MLILLERCDVFIFPSLSFKGTLINMYVWVDEKNGVERVVSAPENGDYLTFDFRRNIAIFLREDWDSSGDNYTSQDWNVVLHLWCGTLVDEDDDGRCNIVGKTLRG